MPAASWLQDGFTPSVLNRAVDVEITPDDTLSCATPLDPNAKENRLPEAESPDLARVGRVRILGAERIANNLEVGKRLCGWARFVARPGQGYPTGWEGELLGGDAKDAKWKLLGAYSWYINAQTNAHLWRAWTFSREGAARRIPIDGGGAFIVHDGVRTQHQGQSVVSKDGEEVQLKSPDGLFAVQVNSDLTAGDAPVHVGKHDGYSFAAVRSEP